LAKIGTELHSTTAPNPAPAVVGPGGVWCTYICKSRATVARLQLATRKNTKKYTKKRKKTSARSAQKKKRALRAREARAFFELLCQGEEFRPRRNSPEKIKKSELPQKKYAVLSALISQPRNTPQAYFPARVAREKTSKSAPKTAICFT
jgi:hypothetical protein